MNMVWLPNPLNGIPVERKPARSAGKFSGGPFKVVHHTTEGATLAGALTALGSAHAESHFVIDDTKIVQLIDTDEASKSLRNSPGGVETNKDGALQMEIVGFAGKAKNPKTLANVAALCRWLEAQYNVPRVWPNGYPKTHTATGQDPGGHNRNPSVWDMKSGHYGHSNVPENTHWDPGYTKEEADIVVPPDAVVVAPPPFVPIKLVVVGVVPPDVLNLRRAPGGALVAGIANGTIIEQIAAAEGKWLNIKTPTGQTGWVWAQFVKPLPAIAGNPPQVGGVAVEGEFVKPV
jgi:hypothetical protein